jgi:hypothetical protein
MRTLLFGNEQLPPDLQPDFFASDWQQVAALFAYMLKK